MRIISHYDLKKNPELVERFMNSLRHDIMRLAEEQFTGKSEFENFMVKIKLEMIKGGK